MATGWERMRQQSPLSAAGHVGLAMTLAIVSTTFLSVPAISSPKKRTPVQEHRTVEYQQEVFLGLDSFPYSGNTGVCIDVGASLSSGTFFEGLQRTGGASGATFHKAGQEIRTFPKSMLMIVETVGAYCEGFLPPIGGPFLNDDYMRSLLFKVSWAKSLSERPAEVSSIRASKVGMTEQGPTRWVYELQVASQDIPITERVILKGYSADGKPLFRLGGGLDPPLPPQWGGPKVVLR
jgi:hypothetical protein